MNLPKNRWLAFASHFGISLLIFIVLSLFIVLFWYPWALFTAAGGWQGIKIVIGVDLVLGPLLTLIVYNINKPLKVLFRDLLVIALIQLSCLTVGVIIVLDERPVAVTYAFDKFYALKHDDFVKAGIDTENLHLNLMTPKIFYTDFTKLSKDTGLGAKVIAGLHNKFGKDLVFRTDLYKPFPKTKNETEAVISDNRLSKHKEHRTDCITVELYTAYETGVVCFDIEKQRFEKFIKSTAIRPGT